MVTTCLGFGLGNDLHASRTDYGVISAQQKSFDFEGREGFFRVRKRKYKRSGCWCFEGLKGGHGP